MAMKNPEPTIDTIIFIVEGSSRKILLKLEVRLKVLDMRKIIGGPLQFEGLLSEL